ncbi:hypothetical protein TRVL_10170 [Trypanosoma vivax]|nr:hypothetical protein TRVL_10170 [Trypanosoma vivax]
MLYPRDAVFCVSPACPILDVIGRHLACLWLQFSPERSSALCCGRSCFISRENMSAPSTVPRQRCCACTHNTSEECTCFNGFTALATHLAEASAALKSSVAVF